MRQDRDSFSPGLPDELALSGLTLRFELLTTATVYGLCDAALRTQPETLEVWHAWLNWLRAIARDLDEGLELDSIPEDLRPGTRLREGQALLDAIDESPDSADLVLLPDRDWTESLERIEEAARRTEKFNVVPMGELGFDNAGVDLYGVVQDSLVLLVYGEEEDWLSAANSAEVYRLLWAAREERAWLRFDSRQATVLPALTGPPLREQLVGDDFLTVMSLGRHMLEANTFYGDLKLDGDELSDKQRAAVIQHLREGALRMRALAGFDPLTEIPTSRGRPNTNLRTVMWQLRRLQRSLVLALSDQVLRRDMVIAVEEFRPKRAR